MSETGERTLAPLLVRVRLVWVDNSDDGPLTIDLAIDDEPNRMPMVRWPCFGMYGSTRTPGNLWPFVLMPDGSIDYGQATEGRPRHASTNLLQRPMKPGTYVTVTDENGEWTYRVASVAVLGQRVLN